MFNFRRRSTATAPVRVPTTGTPAEERRVLPQPVQESGTVIRKAMTLYTGTHDNGPDSIMHVAVKTPSGTILTWTGRAYSHPHLALSKEGDTLTRTTTFFWSSYNGECKSEFSYTAEFAESD